MIEDLFEFIVNNLESIVGTFFLIFFVTSLFSSLRKKKEDQAYSDESNKNQSSVQEKQRNQENPTKSKKSPQARNIDDSFPIQDVKNSQKEVKRSKKGRKRSKNTQKNKDRDRDRDRDTHSKQAKHKEKKRPQKTSPSKQAIPPLSVEKIPSLEGESEWTIQLFDQKKPEEKLAQLRQAIIMKEVLDKPKAIQKMKKMRAYRKDID